MNLIWATLGYAILSSVIPIFNIEVYLAAIATQVSPEQALPLALMAGIGQALGKLVWYWSVVRSMELPWMQRRLASEKRQAQLATWQSRIAGRPFLAGGVTFFSGLVGIPPLLVMGVAAEASHGDPAISPYAVGAITFGILAALLVVLLMFGAGREHS